MVIEQAIELQEARTEISLADIQEAPAVVLAYVYKHYENMAKFNPAEMLWIKQLAELLYFITNKLVEAPTDEYPFMMNELHVIYGATGVLYEDGKKFGDNILDLMHRLAFQIYDALDEISEGKTTANFQPELTGPKLREALGLQPNCFEFYSKDMLPTNSIVSPEIFSAELCGDIDNNTLNELAKGNL